MLESFSVTTSQTAQFVEITDKVESIVSRSGVSEGLAVIFVPHTTAAVTINESADPSVRQDILNHLDKMIPQSSSFLHAEGNSPAHIKAALIGSSVTVIISGSKMLLGTWQGIFFCEFDGPRSRRVQVQIIGE